jgi:glycerophosphoryl diester phosphodiesterase
VTTPLVIAHRGRPLGLPENSLAGVRAAFAQGADAVEVDVRRALDGKAVLMHDWHLWRAARLPLPVSIVPSGLRQVFRLRGGGRMPLLSEALQGIPKDRIAVLDIKEAGAVSPALAAVRQSGHPFEVWSGRRAVLDRTAALAPECPRAIYRWSGSADVARSFIREAAESGCRGICLTWEVVDGDLVAEASARGLRAYSEETDLARLTDALAAGLDGIVTDRPAEVRAKLAALEAGAL